MEAENLFGIDNYEAMVLYKKAYGISEKENDFLRMANLCVDISSVYHQISDYKAALSYCKRGFSILKNARTKPDSIVFKLYSSTGTMYKNLFQLDSTLANYENANQLILKHPKLEAEIPEYVLHHYNSYGKWLISYGENKRGLLFLDKAKFVAKKYKYFEDADIINTNIGTLYNRLGEYEKAKIYFHEAYINQKDLSILKCYALIGEGLIDINLNEIQSGIDLILKAKKDYKVLLYTKKSTKSYSFESNSNYNLAIGYQKLGKKKESLMILKKIISEYKKRDIQRDELLTKTYIKTAELYVDEPQKALEYIQKSQISNTEKNLPNDFFTKMNPKYVINEKLFFESSFFKAKMAFEIFGKTRQQKYLQLSVLATQNATICLKKLRENYFDEEAKLFLNSQLKSFYEFSIGLYILEDTKTNQYITHIETFNFIESYKSSVLSDLLSTTKAKFSTIPSSLLLKEQYLDAQISKIRSKDGLSKEKSERLLHLEAEKYFLEEKLKSQYPKYLKMKSEYASLGIEEIQKKLNDDEAYLSYFLSQDKILIFIVSNNSFELKTIPYQKNEFEKKISFFKNILFKNPGLDTYNGTFISTYLYSLLYQPIRSKLLNKNRLIINRDRLLNFLPFEILETGEYLNDFLFKKHSISYVYDNNITLKSESYQAKSMVLGIAPFTGDDLPVIENDLILVQSKKQIENVADNLLIGKNATKQNFLNYLSKSQIIYFATHSILNDITPNESFIQFFPDENNLLKVEEIYKLDFSQTKLVVLTSCEAGIGKTHFSEGMLSISRAFHIGGCPSVLTTLWSSNDASVTILSTFFNKYLRAGYDKDVALQKARIEFLISKEGKKYNHPYFWANLILVGDKTALYSENHNKLRYLIIFILLLETIVIGFYFKGKFSKNSTFSPLKQFL
ncbi:CHAT domain-containing protein [Lacihabitans sp. LS3-19]|uniref:CHAT domain-containing protein n=1 Tax=Lacihabitans sp. LS3-19 TaxID=2487335 RepID=UPI0020CB88F7|nr:CHAT domain-containing protein [Lacihabitans sp. LS3-19]